MTLVTQTGKLYIINRYRLIQDEDGTLYELSTNLGTTPLTNIPRVQA